MNIFALWGEIEINRKQAEADIKAVEQQAEKSGRQMEGAFGKVTKAVGAVLNEVQQLDKRLETAGKALTSKFGLQFGALTALMGGLAKATSNYTAAVKDNAAIVGLSTESYQELEYAMAQSGLEQGEFIRMMGRVNQRIGFARQGNEKYRKSMQNLGISLEDVDKGLVGTEETFLAMINHLHEMDDAQKQAALAGDFFGVMLSRRMMPLIRSGVESVEELRERAQELGLVMDDLAIAKGKLLSDTLDDMAFTAKGLGRIFGSEMHAPMINISRAITDLLAGLSEWLTENPKVVRQIVMWGGAIAGVLGVLTALGTTLIVTGKIVGAIGTIFNLLISKPMLIIAAMGLLYLAWENDWLGMQGVVQSAIGFIEEKLDGFKTWWETSEVAAVLKGLWTDLEEIWNNDSDSLIEKIGKSIAAITQAFVIEIGGIVWKWGQEQYNNLVDWWNGYTEEIIDEDGNIIGLKEHEGFKHRVGQILISIGKAVWGFLGETYDSLSDWWNGYLEEYVDEDGNVKLKEHPGFKYRVAEFLVTVGGVLWRWGEKTYTSLSNWWNGYTEEITDEDGNVIGLKEIPGFKQTLTVFLDVNFGESDPYKAIKKGFDTGDWADFWGIASETWSKGVLIGITLSSVIQGVTAAMDAIRTGLGLAAAAGAGLGVHGLLGLITVGLQLMEAQAEGSYQNFAENVVFAGLAAVLAGLAFSPKLGALAFTVFMNLKLGETFFDSLRGLGEKWDNLFKEWTGYTPDELGEIIHERLFGPSSSSFGGGGGGARGALQEAAEDVEDLTDELSKLEKQALIVAEVMRQGGTIEQALAILGIAYWETRGHGGYTHTDPTTGEVIRGDAGEYGIGQVMPGTGKDVWTRLWKQPAETWDESMLEDLDTNIAMMVSYFLDRYRVHGEDLRLAIEGYNRGTAIDGMQAYTAGVVEWMEGEEGQSLANILYDGMENALEAMVQAGYDMDGDVREMAEFLAQSIADYMVGQSPPPEGPLSDIDEGGQRVTEAWVEGMVEGVEESTPLLTRALDHIKTLLSSVWEKVPEDIRLPIENAIQKAEDALFRLDELYDELQNAITGGDDPEEQAKSFMDRLKGALDAKLKELDDPLNRFVDTVNSAALHLGEVIRAMSSGNWVGAILSIIMETESFAKAMELIGKVLAPVVALFDNVLRPIIEGLLKLWNGIIDALVSISIFGWKPFAGLKSARIEWDDPDSGSGGSDRSSTSGRQISEITGPTRDLLVDLLSPLANFGQIVAPIQDIRNILYERLPNFNAFETDFAAAGAGAMGTSITIENITVQSLSKDGRGLARDLVDDLERELARRINFGVRGRGGR